MKIVIAASEVTPFARTGGLGDVISSLPKTLQRLGHACVVLMPRYKEVDDKRFGFKRVKQRIPVPTSNNKIVEADIYSARMDGDIPIYFIDHKGYFHRDGLYGMDGKDYPDNAERFAFFSRGCICLLKELGIRPDVIHCNDWQTGLIPVYLKTLYRNDDYFKRTGTIFTIHNAAYQGIFESHKMDVTGLPWEIFTSDGIEYYGKINLLKGGIIFSDIITTVSKTYAKEIQTGEFGCGLDGILKKRSNSLYGIINGIDYNVWDPAKDRFIVSRYSVDDLNGKKACKKDLLSIYGMEFNEDIPLIGIISRLDEQKGFDLIEWIIDDLMKMDVQMCFLGMGKKRYCASFDNIARRHKGRAGIKTVFDDVLAHKIEAGADIFLMPSRYEPCGLNQLYSLKYGAIPVVRNTGGLADTIKGYDPISGEGNGFKFESYSGAALLNTIRSAVDLYKDKKRWRRLMKNAMSEDFSWERPASEYLRLYGMVVDSKQ